MWYFLAFMSGVVFTSAIFFAIKSKRKNEIIKAIEKLDQPDPNDFVNPDFNMEEPLLLVWNLFNREYKMKRFFSYKIFDDNRINWDMLATLETREIARCENFDLAVVKNHMDRAVCAMARSGFSLHEYQSIYNEALYYYIRQQIKYFEKFDLSEDNSNKKSTKIDNATMRQIIGNINLMTGDDNYGLDQIYKHFSVENYKETLRDIIGMLKKAQPQI